METRTFTAFAQEKPNLYLSSNDKDKDWRMTEILVAIIESIIQGDDVFTISSTRIKDVIDYPEQMDIVQIKSIDPKKYFNFIEVRDRNSNVGRNYVQEIVGKRKSTEIQDCKIVSTFGFTQPAKKLAAHEKINLRLFELDISPFDQYWFQTNSTGLYLRQIRLDECLLHVKTNNKFEILASEFPEVQEKLLVIFNENDSPHVAIPIIDIFHKEMGNWKDANKFLFENIPSDGQYHRIKNPVELVDIPSRIHVKAGDSNSDYVPVHGIKFIISSKIDLYKSKLTARYNYLDPISNEILAQCILFDFEVGEKIYFQTFIRTYTNNNPAKFGSVFFE